MEHSLPNPRANALGNGITEADVLGAITKSGYPLQTVVANFFRRTKFRVTEEWGYVDQDEDQLRTIDMKCELPLFDSANLKGDSKVRPTLVVLIECKQSQLPYVFFLSRKGTFRISRF